MNLTNLLSPLQALAFGHLAEGYAAMAQADPSDELNGAFWAQAAEASRRSHEIQGGFSPWFSYGTMETDRAYRRAVGAGLNGPAEWA